VNLKLTNEDNGSVSLTTDPKSLKRILGFAIAAYRQERREIEGLDLYEELKEVNATIDTLTAARDLVILSIMRGEGE
jgi:hypothetical protein